MLKYYMRGLGTGIVITAVIMLFLNKPKDMTREQIIAEAEKLGMVTMEEIQKKEEANEKIETMIREAEENGQQENIASSSKDEDNTEKEDVEEVTDKTAEAEEEAKADQDPEADQTAEPNQATEANKTEQPDAKDDPELVQKQPETEPEEEKIVTDYIQITIESGEVGRTISAKLYEAGLVESVEDYNAFLSANDYSRRLRAGTYMIPVGATKEEIAEILCKL